MKSLAATPSVLDMMSEQLEWTQKLGDAVLAQQADLMDAVQALRLKAQEAGQLKTTPEQIVTVDAAGDHRHRRLRPPRRPGAGAGSHHRHRAGGA